ncbi:hypothetical protein EDD11_004283 [Mortierella claussenii]|nr:hypothetical protein EDD11_004283 [Mortierella claussenii]
MSKTHIAYHSHHFVAAAATIASPLPSPAITLNDSINPWANIATSAPAPAHPIASTGVLAKDLSAPAVVYSNSTQPTISFDGSSQPKNVINDVFLSSTMLYDDVELYLNESSCSSFDSDSDSGFSTPSQHDESHPMTPMSPFMENDSEDQLYAAEEEDEQTADLPEQQEQLVEESSLSESDDTTDMVVDMKRPMFIPVSICDTRDFVAMASLPTPPECNARKHSFDFLSNSDAFLLGGISATKRRRVLSVDMMSPGAPASPPASNAGDDDAELSDAESSADSYMSHRRFMFQMRNIRHLTPTSPSLPEIVCFAPPTHEEYDYHPELDHSDDEEEEEDHKSDEVKGVLATVVPSDLFVVEAGQETCHNAYLSEDNYSSSDDEADFGYHSENRMQIDAMSSSDDSDSDLSEVEEYQLPIRRRGTWHGPSLEEIEKAAAKKNKSKGSDAKIVLPSPPSLAVKQPVAEVAVVTKATILSPAPVSYSAAPVTTKVSCESKQAKSPTLFQILTKANIDWCRYCGTTEGVNWRPGPWGKRTLCNKHGCDFKGYGFACKLPRLDLTSYAHETVDQRIRPVLQHFCHGCQSQESSAGNVMVRCEGCPKAFHQSCHGENLIPDSIALSEKPWFCDETCKDNVKKRRVCVELPKKRLPLMSTPKPAATATMPSMTSTAGPLAAAGSAASEKGRSRGMRASISGEIPSARSK